MKSLDELSPGDRYTQVSFRAARQVINAYSSSFGLATRLLGARHRVHIRNLYAFVRVADELVDGVGADAGLSAVEQGRVLDAFADQTFEAMDRGYSSNPIIHAFAHTARVSNIDESLIKPFFTSMHTDIFEPAEEAVGVGTSNIRGVEHIRSFAHQEHRDYVYGSAEVVGLMCTRVFVREESLTRRQRSDVEAGARSLGAAFQNVNFLRDLVDDRVRLGRDYLGTSGSFGDAERDQWVSRITADLDHARATVYLLPPDARRAVRCALELFAALNAKISRAPAAQLVSERVSLGPARKSWVLGKALLSEGRS